MARLVQPPYVSHNEQQNSKKDHQFVETADVEAISEQVFEEKDGENLVSLRKNGGCSLHQVADDKHLQSEGDICCGRVVRRVCHDFKRAVVDLLNETCLVVDGVTHENTKPEQRREAHY